MKEPFWKTQLCWAIILDILCIGFIALLRNPANIPEVTWTQALLFYSVCLIVCFPIAYFFFWGLDHMPGEKKNENPDQSK